MQKEREEYNTEILEKIYELEKENHDLLNKVKQYQKINTALKIVYWLIILASVFGAYFAIKPIANSFLGENDMNLESIQQETQNIPEVSKIKDIINRFGN